MMIRVKVKVILVKKEEYRKIVKVAATGQWFSPGTPVSFTNKTDRQDVTEILLKVELSTIKPNQTNLIIILIY
jgi:hypothetical protein